ncbi:MAG: hypothetical protein HC842_06080 [Cytophagales bacterium]|nr:hypothetical protein [Cytophagales bacterium]
MNIRLFTYELTLRQTLQLAHSSRATTPAAYLQLEQDRTIGWGEVTFIPYRTERLEHLKQIAKSLSPVQEWSLGYLADYLQKLRATFPDFPASVAAVDMALHQMLAFKQDKTIAALYNLMPDTKPSSFTIGICSKEEMKQLVAQAPQAKYFKLKVSEQSMAKMIGDFMSVCLKPFTVDANQGFADRSKALDWCYRLNGLGVAYFEQPFAAADWEAHQWLKERSPVPIIADESFQTVADLNQVKRAFHGVNIKLGKCGGLAPAYQSLRQAREAGLKTLLGCMSESSLGMGAAQNLGTLADWVDLDGAWLNTNDPFTEKDLNQPLPTPPAGLAPVNL